jgi:hypothetical protein
MTPPIRRRSLSEIADESFGQPPQSDPYKPTGPRIASEARPVERVTAPKRDMAEDAKNLTRQVAQGLTAGFADEGEGAIKAALGPRSYREERDAVRAKNAKFADEFPGTAIAANLAGGIASGAGLAKLGSGAGMVARGLRGVGLSPNVNATATMGQRLAGAAKMGGAAGAVSGAGVADELTDVPKSMLVGGAIGAGAGLGFAGGAELIRGTRNLVSRVGQGQQPAGAIRRAVRADAPDESAAKRVLQRLGNQNMSLDDLLTRSSAADGPDILGEVIGQKGIRDVRTARTLGYEAPDFIEDGLTRRARDEVGRVQSSVRDALGDPIDDEAFKAAKLAEARTNAKPIYEQAVDGVTITDPRLADLLKRPAAASAYDATVKGYANRGQAMPTRAEILQGVRGSADDMADDVIGEVAGTRGPARTASGKLRPVTQVDSDDLMDELIDLTTRQQRDQGMAVYNYVDSDNASSKGTIKIATATRKGGKGVSMQAAAQQRVDQTNGVIDRITAELEERGVDWPEVMARRTSSPNARIADEVRTVPGRGTVSLPDEAAAPTLPSMPAKAVQRWKLELDDEIARLEGKEGGATSQKMAELVQVRDEVESMLYEFSNQADDGAGLWGKAQQTYAKPMRERDAFAQGQAKGRTMQPADQARMMAGPEAEFVAKGVGNTIQEDLGRLQSGAAGRIRNPAPTVMGSDYADARLNVATRGNAAQAAKIRETAANAQRRLQTRNTVLGGSQTADKLADMAEQGMNPGELLQLANSPGAAALKAIGKGANALKRNVVGQDMDAMARVLMAGAPNQMTRAEAVAMLKRMEPAIRAQLVRQMVTRGAVGGAAARSAR